MLSLLNNIFHAHRAFSPPVMQMLDIINMPTHSFAPPMFLCGAAPEEVI